MAATPSAETALVVGQRIILFERPWSTTTRRESKPLDKGRSVIRSYEICLKGKTSLEGIGSKGRAEG
jgi:hypothetical protein